MNWKLRWRVAAAVTVAAMGLAGCASGGDATGTDGEPRDGGTATIALNADPTSLDPHLQPNQPASWIDGLVYSRLLKLDPELALTGDLAESWKQDGPTAYTFNLRSGVKFHNGRELTADDVVYSLDRLRTPETASAKRSWFSGIKSVTAEGASTVKISLSAPDASLASHLANPVAAIVPKEEVAKAGNLNNTMVGSGPYKFVSRTPGVEVVLARNNEYFAEKKAHIDKLVLKPIEDENTRVNALRSGDIDLTVIVPPNLNDTLAGLPGVTITSPRSGQFYALFMQVDRAPFDNVKVRQAVNAAIDRDALVKGVLFGKGQPLYNGPIPPWHPYALDKKINGSADAAKAQQLMTESGLQTPVTVTLSVWSGQTFAVNAGQSLQQTLKPLGINVEIKQYGDYASYAKASFTEPQHHMTIQGFGGKIDPSEWIGEPFGTGSRQNSFGFSDPALDALIAEGIASSDPAARKKAYDRAQEILATTGPALFLFNLDQPDAVADRLKGYQHRPDLLLDGLVNAWVTD
jgi:peptide/nickel transport system substrate-binding protein